MNLSKQWECLVDQLKRLFAEYMFIGNCPELFFEKGILKNFTKFTGKHLCLLFNKVAGWRQAFFKETGTGVVLGILQNFQEHILCETSVNKLLL